MYGPLALYTSTRLSLSNGTLLRPPRSGLSAPRSVVIRTRRFLSASRLSSWFHPPLPAGKCDLRSIGGPEPPPHEGQDARFIHMGRVLLKVRF